MRRARAGARSQRAISQGAAGPVRRILSATRAGAREGMRLTRARLRQRRAQAGRAGLRSILRAGARGLSLAAMARRRRRRRNRNGSVQLRLCDDCGLLFALAALMAVFVLVNGARQVWRLCRNCRPLHENPAPGPAPVSPPPPSSELPAGDGQPELPAVDGQPELPAGSAHPDGDVPVNVTPELAPASAAYGDEQPALTGGSMPRALGPGGNRWAPAMRPAAALPVTGGAATHGEWMMLMDRLREAHAQAMRNYESALSNLQCVNPGRTHFAECVAWFRSAHDYLKRIEAHITAVDVLEGPIKSATDTLGGPAERADSSYHAYY
jgi:hypothetical protein